MKKILAIVLALALIVTVFAACGTKKPNNDKPLVVGYSNFSEKFSPFFSETAYDQDVWAMTSANLLDIDRQGAIVEKGKTGETRPYNGTDYTFDATDGWKAIIDALAYDYRNGLPKGTQITFGAATGDITVTFN